MVSIEEDHNLTGYPHIDKPWMQYYEKNIEFNGYNKKIMDYLCEKTSSFDDYTALNYYGKKISFGDFKEKTVEAAKVVSSLGIREGQRVLFLAPNIPETAYLFYATSIVGAIPDFIDPRPDSIDLKTSAKKVYDVILKEKIDYIVSLDLCYLSMLKPIENELKHIGVDNILLISASDSMDIYSKIEYVKQYKFLNTSSIIDLIKLFKQQKKMSDEIDNVKKDSILHLVCYSDIRRDCKYVVEHVSDYKPGSIVAITHTSGTSGIPKPIILTNENLNYYNEQTYVANMPVNVHDKAIHMLPYFAAYGLVNVLHAGLCHGNELVEVPEFKPVDFGKLLIINKPNIVIGAHTWILSMLNDSSLDKEDLSYLKMLTYGGASLSAKDEYRVNEFLKYHGASIKVTKGHGMSEVSGCSSFATSTYNDLGGLGIPMPGTIYGIVDPNTKKPLRFSDDKDYILGEMIISSECVSLGSLDEINYMEKRDYDGKQYILTNDIAKMYKDGRMEFLARSDRGFTRYDGYKIKTYEVEKMVETNPLVEECVVIPYKDADNLNGNNVMAVIRCCDNVFSENDEIDITKSIINSVFINNPNASIRQIPSKVRYVKKFPLNNNGKLDYKGLYEKTMDCDEIDVKISESNMSVDSITILHSKNNKVLVLK